MPLAQTAGLLYYRMQVGVWDSSYRRRVLSMQTKQTKLKVGLLEGQLGWNQDSQQGGIHPPIGKSYAWEASKS